MTFTTEQLIAYARTLEHQKLFTSTGAPFTVAVMNERLSFYISGDLGMPLRNLSKTSLNNIVSIYLRTRSFEPADYSGYSTKAVYTLPVIGAYLRSTVDAH